MRVHRRPFKLTMSQMLTIGVGVVAVVLIFSMAQKSVLCQQRQADRDRLAGAVSQIDTQVQMLRELVDQSGSRAAVESSLREDFGLVGWNEGTAILSFEESPAAAQPIAADRPAAGQAAPPHWADWVHAWINP
jgi:hypothetical protein